MNIESSKRVVLATGEGAHTHAVSSATNIDFSHMGERAMMFELKAQAVVTHDEHDRIVLEPGKYYKTNQVEFDPFNQRVAWVYD
jgi:hypothetical protein